ncbi:hypothetical protein TD95_002988 [Thielaviopsis punctulata]|uniref:Uncharacterized protein n=1 Tax=Thielaviopsis punctulata TaxID=72032 RepID=A0A0F4ZH99_9PEZI|nr:hypothetical protein TD95_002988 [Thielaviopsis punctulata]
MSGTWGIVDRETDSFGVEAVADDLDSNPPTRGHSFRSNLSFPLSEGSFGTNDSFGPNASFDNNGSFDTGSGSNSANDASQRTNEFSDDERLLRDPLEPSLPPSGSRHYKIVHPDSLDDDSHSQLIMPVLEIDSQTGREFLRYRTTKAANRSDPRHPLNIPPRVQPGSSHRRPQRNSAPSFVDALLGALFDSLVWLAGLAGHAFRFAQKPLALLMAVYLFLLGMTILKSIMFHSVTNMLSPLCSVPGISSMSVCALSKFPLPNADADADSFVEFDGLMSVQGKFEQVLEKSVEGVALPLEMKRSETALRDLRSLLRFSDLPARDELVGHFDGYIDVARKVVRHMQMFNTHVGTAVDAVLSINHWTLRFLDSAVLAEQEAEGKDGINYHDGRSSNLLVRMVMMPLDLVTGAPPARKFSEEVLLGKYIEHTEYVSKRIAELIIEAQYILGLLNMAEDHLSLIYGVSTREGQQAKAERNAIRGGILTFFGGNRVELKGLDNQIHLLENVDVQRSQAMSQLTALVVELEGMQAGLEDLRDRVAAPNIAQMGTGTRIPLQVHIDTINKGVERLDSKRAYMRVVESEQMQRALDRARGREDGRVPAISGKMRR